MMMSSTSMTSTSGVTLMSDLTPPPPPKFIAMVNSPIANASGRLLDEVVDQLRRGVVHLDVEVFETAGQEVVEPHRRNRDEQTERGFDEGFCDTGRHGADTTRAGRRDTHERVDDADDGAEQSDEGRRGTDRCEGIHALLEVVR